MNTELTCIALDLETTGLDTYTDTIIEIAAVQCTLKKRDGAWEVHNITERSMLINPGFPLAEEVSMITGITDHMLEGKKQWSHICEKVKTFFEWDQIIVGHNVFFDIDMLEAHGISLRQHRVIDTFELAEIFSWDAESLNLGFLGDHYHITKRWPEHRALTDVWMSIDLLVLYLSRLEALTASEYTMWNMIASREMSGSLRSLPVYTENPMESTRKYLEWKHTFHAEPDVQIHASDAPVKPEQHEWYSLNGYPDEERILIEATQKKYGTIQILSRSHPVTDHLMQLFSWWEGIRLIKHTPITAFVSPQAVFEAIESADTIDRRYLICLLRIGFWLIRTKTGLLREIKWYGEEREYHTLFSTMEHEWHKFRKKYNTQYQDANIILYTAWESLPKDHLPLMLRDVALLESNIRLALSERIMFDKLFQDIEKIGGTHSTQIIDALQLVQALYESIPGRPTGLQSHPPWKYGETYSLSQDTVWTQWGVWLVIMSKKLRNIFEAWKQEHDIQCLSRENIIRLQRICKSIDSLLRFHVQNNTHESVVLSITPKSTTLHLLHRDIPADILWSYHSLIGYGYGIHTSSMEKFLSREWHNTISIQSAQPSYHQSHLKYQSFDTLIPKGKVLILTTSLKHIRELGVKYHKYHPFLQGISGWKAKIQHYFQNAEDTAIIIGLIDTWKDSFELFKHIQQIIIAKIPFDPPTDPYFLVKTRGMSHHFDTYSQPIVIAKLNTLIGNYLSVKPDGICVCTDDRIQTSIWGKSLRENLI